MTTDTASMAEALTDLPDAPPAVRQAIEAQLLYALGLRPRPAVDDTDEVEAA